MQQVHEGGCVCGAVRYRARNAPLRTSACHCTFCQRRTGSAFGMGAFFKDEDVELSGIARTTYEHRSDESDRSLKMEFCPRCGTTVTWTAEAMPGARALAIGTFDDPRWIRIERFSWMRSAHPWITPPAGIEVLEQSGLPKPKG